MSKPFILKCNVNPLTAEEFRKALETMLISYDRGWEGHRNTEDVRAVLTIEFYTKTGEINKREPTKIIGADGFEYVAKGGRLVSPDYEKTSSK